MNMSKITNYTSSTIFDDAVEAADIENQRNIIRREVLMGAFTCFDSMNYNSNNSSGISSIRKLTSSWCEPSWKLRVFVSSTFTDTIAERNVLMEEILPLLKNKGKDWNIQVIFVDMRWGVRDENTLDHRTWIECVRELENCRDESSGLFFLSLQSLKYGYTPLPKYLSQYKLDERIRNLQGDLKDLTSKWYKLDNNAIPPHYRLRNLEVMSDDSYWKEALPKLGEALTGLEFDEERCPGLLVGHSVTEWEVKTALHNPESLPFTYWMHREFDDGVIESLDPYKLFNDARENPRMTYFNDLINWMKNRFPDGKYKQFKVKSFESFKNQDFDFKLHINEWKDWINLKLFESLDSVISLKEKWNSSGVQNSNYRSLTGQYLSDSLHHCQWAYKKCHDFVGREEIIMEATNYILKGQSLQNSNIKSVETKNKKYLLDSENSFKSWNNGKEQHYINFSFDAVSLYLVGNSGSGKTSLMAKIADKVYRELKNNNNEIPVIIRFCGTSSKSKTSSSLIKSICRQIEFCCRLCDTRHFDDDSSYGSYDRIIDYFKELLNKHAVILFIDSLDQLNNENGARSELNFLSNIKPHKDTRVIVSTLPDLYDPVLKQYKYMFMCETRLKDGNVKFMSSDFQGSNNKNDSEEYLLLCKILSNKNRTLSTKQKEIVKAKLFSCEKLMLYIKLLARIVEEWTSDMEDSSLIVGDTVGDLINFIVDKIERSYGSIFTKFAFAMITFTVNGVNDDEMEDLLSLDDNVLNSVFQYSKREIPRIPSHVWIRLKSEIKDLTVEQESGNLFWYHRQLQEVISERFSIVEKQHYCSVLAKYFAGLVEESERKRKLISSQYITHDNLNTFSIKSKINYRRAEEAASHLIESDMLDEAISELCNLQTVCSKIRCKLGLSFIEELVKLRIKVINKYGENNQKALRITDYLKWIQQDFYKLQANPMNSLIASATAQMMASNVRCDAIEFIKLFEDQNLQLSPQILPGINSWDCGVAIGHIDNDKSISEINIRFQSNYCKIRCISLSGDGRYVASGGDHGLLFIWDIVKCSQVLRLQDPNFQTLSYVSWSSDDKLIIIGGFKAFTIWDATFGYMLKHVTSEDENISSVRFLAKSNNILCHGMFSRNAYTIIDLDRCSVLKVISVDWTNGSDLDPEGQRIIFYLGDGDNKTLCIKDINSDDESLVFLSFVDSDEAEYLKWSSDGTFIAYICNDKKTMKVFSSTQTNLYCKFSAEDPISSLGAPIVWTNDCTLVACMAYSSAIWISNIALWSIEHQALLCVFDFEKLGDDFYFSINADKLICFDNFDILVYNIDKSAIKNCSNKSFSKISSLSTISWSCDSKKLVTGSTDCIIRVWDAESFQCLYFYKEHTEDVMDISCHPINQTIASCSADRTIKLWDLVEKRLISTMSGHDNLVCSVEWSNDGLRLVSSSLDHTIRVWDPLKGLLLLVINMNDSENYRWGNAMFDCTDKKIIFYERGIWTFWDSTTGAPLKEIRYLDDDKQLLATMDLCTGSWRPDHKAFVYSKETHFGHFCIGYYDINKNKKDENFAHSSTIFFEINCLSWSKDGSRLLSVHNHDNEVVVWDSATRKILTRLYHTNTVKSSSFSPDGKLIVSSPGFNDKDQRFFIWKSFSLDRKKLLYRNHFNVSVDEDKYFYIKNNIGYIKSINNNVLTQKDLSSHGNIVLWTISPNFEFIAFVSSDDIHNVFLFSTSSNSVLKTSFEDKHGATLILSWSHKGDKVAIGYSSNLIIIWSKPFGNKNISNLFCSLDWVTLIQWTLNDKYIASSTASGDIYFWEVSSSLLINKIVLSSWILSFIFSSKGKLAFAASENKLHFYHLSFKNMKKKNKKKKSSHDSESDQDEEDAENEGAVIYFDSNIISCCLSPDDKKVAIVCSGNPKVIEIIDHASSDKIIVSIPFIEPIYSIYWNRKDNNIISELENNSFYIWKDFIQKPLSYFDFNDDMIQVACLTSDYKFCATGSCDGVLKIWNIKAKKVINKLKKIDSGYSSLCYNQKGDILASGCDYGHLYIYKVDNFGEPKLLFKANKHNESIALICWNRDGNFLGYCNGSGGKVFVWSVEKKDIVTTFSSHKEGVFSVSWNPMDNNRIASACSRLDEIKIWDPFTGEIFLTKRFLRHFSSLKWTNDGFNIICGFTDCKFYSILIVNSVSGEIIYCLKGIEHAVDCFLPMKNNKILASINNTIILWNPTSSNIEQTLDGSNEYDNFKGIVCDEKYVFAISESGVYSWDLSKSSQTIKSLE